MSKATREPWAMEPRRGDRTVTVSHMAFAWGAAPFLGSVVAAFLGDVVGTAAFVLCLLGSTLAVAVDHVRSGDPTPEFI